MQQSPEIINASVRQCPACGMEGYVIDTRAMTDGTIRRRRICRECGARWNTKEIPVRERKPMSDMLRDAGFE